VGHITPDTRTTGFISSKVKGRIERLYVRYKYQRIQKGQRIMDIYSPELMTAQQNFIFLLKNDAGNSSLINAAGERLILMGLTRSQVQQLARTHSPIYSLPVLSSYSGYVTDPNDIDNGMERNTMNTMQSNELGVKEGMYVESGQAIFSVTDPRKALILLDVFPEQQFMIRKGTPVTVTPETEPQRKFRGIIDYIEPLFRQGTKTLTARVYFNNAAMQLSMGSRVTAAVTGSTEQGSWLPKEAVLSLGRDKIVFLKVPGGFKAHKISTGIQLNSSVQVLAGLSTTDSVAITAQFLADNESFIKTNER
jgi:membrane fusion protein, copper/silver efflux system